MYQDGSGIRSLVSISRWVWNKVISECMNMGSGIRSLVSMNIGSGIRSLVSVSR